MCYEERMAAEMCDREKKRNEEKRSDRAKEIEYRKKWKDILLSFGVYAFTWKENESSCYSNAKGLMFLMFPYFLSIVSFVIMIS